MASMPWLFYRDRGLSWVVCDRFEGFWADAIALFPAECCLKSDQNCFRPSNWRFFASLRAFFRKTSIFFSIFTETLLNLRRKDWT